MLICGLTRFAKSWTTWSRLAYPSSIWQGASTEVLWVFADQDSQTRQRLCRQARSRSIPRPLPRRSRLAGGRFGGQPHLPPRGRRRCRPRQSRLAGSCASRDRGERKPDCQTSPALFLTPLFDDSARLGRVRDAGRLHRPTPSGRRPREDADVWPMEVSALPTADMLVRLRLRGHSGRRQGRELDQPGRRGVWVPPRRLHAYPLDARRRMLEGGRRGQRRCLVVVGVGVGLGLGSCKCLVVGLDPRRG